jgi:hypothetical protein
MVPVWQPKSAKMESRIACQSGWFVMAFELSRLGGFVIIQLGGELRLAAPLILAKAPAA